MDAIILNDRQRRGTLTQEPHVIAVNRVRFDRRGVPWGAFDWITGDPVRWVRRVS